MAIAESTVDPQKWLETFQRWCPAVPIAEHVAFINSWIEVAGPRRVEWLDSFIVQADNQERRLGSWKLNRVKQYEKDMREDPNHLPRLRKLRGSPDLNAVLKILGPARNGMSAREIWADFRRTHRDITYGALVNVLISLEHNGRIARYSDGIYGVPREEGNGYESGTQVIFKLVLAVPEATRAELCAATGWNRARVGAAIANLRTRGLFDPHRIAVSAEARAKTERGETIRNKKGKVVWAPEVLPSAPPDPSVFTSVTALRPERAPLGDVEARAEIERVLALPQPQYEAERQPVASRVGVRVSVLNQMWAERQRIAQDIAALEPELRRLVALPPSRCQAECARVAARLRIDAPLLDLMVKLARSEEVQPKRGQATPELPAPAQGSLHSKIGFVLFHREWFSRESGLRGDEYYPFAWLMLEAAHEPCRRYIDGKPIDLQRGQLAASVRYLAKAWGTTKRKVEGILARLSTPQTRGRIGIATGTGITLITICNYDVFQFSNEGSGTARGQLGDKKGKKETRKEKNRVRVLSSAPTPLLLGSGADADADDAPSAGKPPSEQAFELAEKIGHWVGLSGPTNLWPEGYRWPYAPRKVQEWLDRLERAWPAIDASGSPENFIRQVIAGEMKRLKDQRPEWLGYFWAPMLRIVEDVERMVAKMGKARGGAA
jgi:hypothetical protein